MPSYTDLYYSDPANQGNPNLRPETGWSYEAGGQYGLSDFTVATGTVFVRNERDLIDYELYGPLQKYYAVNLISASIRGSDLSFEWSSGRGTRESSCVQFGRVPIQYTYLESTIDRHGAYNSKYTFTHPKHKVNTDLGGSLPLAVETNLSAIYKYRSASSHFILLNLRLAKQFASLTAFLNCTNLLNVHYAEIVGVPQPGRWLIAGLKWNIS